MVQTLLLTRFHYNALLIPREFFLDTSLKRIIFEIFSNFHNFSPIPCSHQQRRATPDVRLCWKRPRRPKPCTHAPCNFRLESVPLPRFSLFPLLSKVRATSSSWSHEKTTPIIREVKLSEKKPNNRRGTGIVQRKRSACCRQDTCKISGRSSLGLGFSRGPGKGHNCKFNRRHSGIYWYTVRIPLVMLVLRFVRGLVHRSWYGFVVPGTFFESSTKICKIK